MVSELEQFKENVNSLYVLELSNDNENVMTEDLKEKLEDDFDYEIVESNQITGIQFSRHSKSINSLTITDGEESGVITAKVEKDKYYVNLKGIYYSFKVENGKIVIGEPVGEMPKNDGTTSDKIVLESSSNKLRINNIDDNNFTVTGILGEGQNTDELKVSAKIGGTVYSELPVVVTKEMCVVTILASDGGKVAPNTIDSYEPYTKIQVIPTANEGYIFDHWELNSNPVELELKPGEEDVYIYRVLVSPRNQELLAVFIVILPYYILI